VEIGPEELRDEVAVETGTDQYDIPDCYRPKRARTYPRAAR